MLFISKDNGQRNLMKEIQEKRHSIIVVINLKQKKLKECLFKKNLDIIQIKNFKWLNYHIKKIHVNYNYFTQ